MKRKTYQHKRTDGSVVKVAVPENPDPVAMMRDAIRQQLSPHAVASIISYLQPARTNSLNVDREVCWFMKELTTLLGGPQEQAHLAEELGL